MHGRSGGIGYQMSVAHGHSNGSMPHQSLNAVYVFAVARQPACKSVSEAVKHDAPGSVIQFYAVIEADGVNKCPERMGQTCAHTVTRKGRKDQACEYFFILLFSALLKDTQCRIVQRYFAARLTVGFIAHSEYGMNQVHIRPFQALKLPAGENLTSCPYGRYEKSLNQ